MDKYKNYKPTTNHPITGIFYKGDFIMNNGQMVIQTNGLSKQYKGVNALQGLNLQVAPNSIFGFLGPNGAGKSTAIKLLLGLIRPTGGGAAVFGLDSVRDSVAIRQRVGYLAQDPRYYQHMTARETMRFAARFFYKGPKDVIEARIEETLELVGLEDKADRPIKGFSGGERQRLGIAQAQVNYPDLLILDEPAAALDPMGRRDVLEVMARLRKHTTIFYSTHILEDVQRVSDSVAILNKGQLVAQAPIEQLLAGNGSAIYNLTVRGDGRQTHQTLTQLPWVSAVTTTTENNDKSCLQITICDENAAEEQLLRLFLADGQTTVTEFGRKKFNLEEIFMQMVDGGH
jgi:ABC-2 type transport system ATP-binding protein